jgi:signal transduction histidine kinase
MIWGDRIRLLETLQNLIENAIKFMGEQSSPRVEIGAREEEGAVTCWVADNGIGIDPRYQDKIFELFERLNPEIDGTGVGLTLVRRIVEVHGGRCWIESPGPGLGSKFFFLLPLPEGASTAAP